MDLHKNKAAYRVRKGAAVMIYGHARTNAGPVVAKYVRFYRSRCARRRWAFIRRATSLSPTGWYSTTVHPRRSTTYKVVSYSTIFLLPATSNYVTLRVR